MEPRIVGLQPLTSFQEEAAPRDADGPRQWPPLEGLSANPRLTPEAIIGIATQQAGEAILLWEAETRIIVALNDTACRWLESTRDVLTGSDVTALTSGIAPAFSDFDQPFVETRAVTRPVVIQGTHMRSDGRRFAVETALTRITVGGRGYVLAVARDIERRAYSADALKDIEGRYQALFERSSDAVFLAARSGQVLDANSAAEALFGWGRDELAALNARRLFRLRRAADIPRLQPAGLGDGRAVEADITILRKDGTRISGTMLATPLRGPGNSLRGYQCVVRPTRRERQDTARDLPASQTVTIPSPSLADPVVPRPNRVMPGAEKQEAPRPTDAKSRKVLVVSHDADAEAEVRGILERAGIRTMSRRDGARPGEHVAVVVFQMAPGEPVVPGALPTGTPAVIIGEEVELGTAQRLGLGAVAFLPRPLHPLALIYETRRLLAG